MDAPLLILASASPRRLELLRQLGFHFKVVPSNGAEVHEDHLSAGELAQINAYRKARAVSKHHPDAIVIGVDTLVAAEGRIFGKPQDRKEAREMLTFLQGRTHQVTTAVCLICLRGHRQKIFFEQTDVTFRRLTAAQIRLYHRQVNPLDKAGAYGIQEKGEMLVESVAGSYSNVVGLPMERLGVELGAFMEGLGVKMAPMASRSFLTGKRVVDPSPHRAAG